MDVLEQLMKAICMNRGKILITMQVCCDLKREARHSAYRDHLKKQGERQNCSVRKTEKNFR